MEVLATVLEIISPRRLVSGSDVARIHIRRGASLYERGDSFPERNFIPHSVACDRSRILRIRLQRPDSSLLSEGTQASGFVLLSGGGSSWSHCWETQVSLDTMTGDTLLSTKGQFVVPIWKTSRHFLIEDVSPGSHGATNIGLHLDTARNTCDNVLKGSLSGPQFGRHPRAQSFHRTGFAAALITRYPSSSEDSDWFFPRFDSRRISRDSLSCLQSFFLRALPRVARVPAWVETI